MWGEPVFNPSSATPKRTIPTRVGRTSVMYRVKKPNADHPHACGENRRERLQRSFVTGPSPRVWGELFGSMINIVEIRTIPTRVGRTYPHSPDTPRMADHPHACGENGCMVWIWQPKLGPSPRVWGELPDARSLKPSSRTIPTRVGRTSGVPFRLLFSPDHPHACGENLQTLFLLSCFYGPSPRVWGERGAGDVRPESERTIPTRVGRTMSFVLRM